MKIRPTPPQSVIKEWLAYNPASGEFCWIKEPRAARPLIGLPAGSRRPSGYVLIGLRGYGSMMAHRLAWVYVYGDLSTDVEIDHIDGDPSNNTIANLRLATSSQQKQNKRAQSNNRAGLKGAMYHAAHKGKKWRSQIKVGGRLLFLGYFNTAVEAHEAYAKAAEAHFGEFGRAA